MSTATIPFTMPGAAAAPGVIALPSANIAEHPPGVVPVAEAPGDVVTPGVIDLPGTGESQPVDHPPGVVPVATPETDGTGAQVVPIATPDIPDAPAVVPIATPDAEGSAGVIPLATPQAPAPPVLAPLTPGTYNPPGVTQAQLDTLAANLRAELAAGTQPVVTMPDGSKEKIIVNEANELDLQPIDEN